MSKSGKLRASDILAITRLTGECRELGVEVDAWQRHLIAGLIDLTGGLMGLSGELVDFRGPCLKFLGMTDWGWAFDSDRSHFLACNAEASREPEISSSWAAYRRRAISEDGVCSSRSELFTDREWAPTWDCEVVLRPIRVGDILWCNRSIPGAWDDGSIAVVMYRPSGARDFGARDRALVRETMAAVAPLAGGPLARFADPSASSLAPRARAVLRCLLEGDGDKQIAARLRLSPYTVNQYTKHIYRHFRARGRADLMALWIRRRWGLPPAPDG